MPPVALIIASVLAKTIAGVAISTWLTVASLAITAIQTIRKAFRRDPDPIAQLTGPKQTIRSEIVPERSILGRARVPGVLAYYGSYQRNAVMGLVLSQGECEAIEKVWIDGHEVLLERTAQTGGDKLVPASSSEYRGKIEFYEYFAADGTQGAFLRGISTSNLIDNGPEVPSDGSNYIDGYPCDHPDVMTFSGHDGCWLNDTDGSPNFSTENRLHFSTDLTMPGSTSPFRTPYPGWSTEHKLDGVSWVAVKLIQPQYGQEISERFWTRLPNFEFLVKGKKLTWPGQSTPVWTENAAAIRYWWETVRRGRDASQIDETDFTAAYTLCDEDVTVALTDAYTKGGFKPTSKRYSINGVISSGDSVSAIEEQIDLAWAGQTVESRGIIHFRPGVQDQSACAVIGDADVLESPRIQPWAPLQERINAITAQIGQSAVHEYTRLSLPEFVDSSAQTRDGEKRSGSMVFGFISDPIAAVRLQVINLRRVRESLRLSLVVRPGSNPSSSNPNLHFDRLGFLPTDCILVTNSELGLTDFRMVLEQIVIRTDWAIELTLREDLTDTYDDTLILPSLSPRVIRLAENTVYIPKVGGLVSDEIAEVALDGTVVARLVISWNAEAVIQTEIQIREKISGSSWESTIVSGIKHSLPVVAGKTYEYRARHYGISGVAGEWTDIQENTIDGDLTPPAAPTDLDLDFRPLGFRAKWVNPTDDDFISASIYMGTTNQFSASILVASIASDTYEHSGLIAGTPYYVWVKAKDNSGNLSAGVGPETVTPITGSSEGAEIFTGASKPTPNADDPNASLSPAGSSRGDLYIQNNGIVWKLLSTGLWATTGTDLTDVGESLYTVQGSSPPANTIGKDKDVAISLDTGTVWHKVSGVWVEEGDLTGGKGDDGDDGSDGKGFERVFRRTTTESVPSTPTSSRTVDDSIPSSWMDDPVGPTVVNMYEWVSLRTGSTGAWGTWGTPALWAKYSRDGDDGSDGKGFERVFRRTTTESAPSTPTSSRTMDDSVPSSWTDDPVGPTVVNMYEWVSLRTGTTGAWGTWGTPALWAKYSRDGDDGSDGKGFERVFRRTTTESAPSTPTSSRTVDDSIPSGWVDDPVGPTVVNMYEWVSLRTGSTGAWGNWRSPSLWAKYSRDGDDGSDGKGFERVFRRTTTESAPSTPTSSRTVDDSIPSGWVDDPVGPTVVNMYEWVSLRTGSTGAWGNWRSPSLWAKYSRDGDDGSDGKGFEWVFRRTTTASSPSTPTSSRTVDDSVPSGWTDNPVGPTSSIPYEWASLRKGTTGAWGSWSTPAEWAKHPTIEIVVNNSQGSSSVDIPSTWTDVPGCRISRVARSKGSLLFFNGTFDGALGEELQLRFVIGSSVQSGTGTMAVTCQSNFQNRVSAQYFSSPSAENIGQTYIYKIQAKRGTSTNIPTVSLRWFSTRRNFFVVDLDPG